MLRLGRADLEATLAFVNGLVELAGDVAEDPAGAATGAAQPDVEAPYPKAVLASLQVLVPSAAVLYQDVDLVQRRFDATAWLGPGGDEDDEEELYWSSGRCPISAYRDRTGDLATVRMSDVIELRRYRQTALYRDYFRPARIEHLLDLGLRAGGGRHRSFVLFREGGARDFSDRDRAVLDVVRPHLFAFEAQRELRRRLGQILRDRQGRMPSTDLGLTSREREIVLLVAQGKTNAEIAAELWVAPSTVKKHLENVYLKLGVGRRAAAVQLLRAAN